MLIIRRTAMRTVKVIQTSLRLPFVASPVLALDPPGNATDAVQPAPPGLAVWPAAIPLTSTVASLHRRRTVCLKSASIAAYVFPMTVIFQRVGVPEGSVIIALSTTAQFLPLPGLLC